MLRVTQGLAKERTRVVQVTLFFPFPTYIAHYHSVNTSNKPRAQRKM